MFEGYVTLKEAKKISGIKIETLKRQCRLGKIPGAIKEGKTWFIPRSTVVNKSGLLNTYLSLKSDRKQYFRKHDDLFENFGPGNTIDIILQPYERLKAYEGILNELKTADPIKYDQVHKGTPFYFMSWLAFTTEDYSKAIFYMEAAAHEDIKTFANNNPKSDKWHIYPAASFLLLNGNLTGPTARNITLEIENEFVLQLERFNKKTGANLTKDILIERFIKNKIHKSEFRSIISALYAFLLECRTKILMIRLKSNDNEGSMEPFFIHLFRGCLVFESLMKSMYQNHSSSKTLGGYLAVANRDLQIGQIKPPIYKGRKEWILADILNLLPAWDSEPYQEKAIAVTYAIRNTTGHDLGWPNKFNTSAYTELFESILDAIFWYIWKKEI